MSADIVVEGDLGLAEGASFDAAVSTLLPSRSRRISVDLSGVTFMDCAGINALLRGHAAARVTGCGLELIGVSHVAWRMLAAGHRARPYPHGALELPKAAV